MISYATPLIPSFDQTLTLFGISNNLCIYAFQLVQLYMNMLIHEHWETAAIVAFFALLFSLSTHVTMTLIASLLSFLAALITLIAFACDIALYAFVKHEFSKVQGVKADTVTGPGKYKDLIRQFKITTYWLCRRGLQASGLHSHLSYSFYLLVARSVSDVAVHAWMALRHTLRLLVPVSLDASVAIKLHTNHPLSTSFTRWSILTNKLHLMHVSCFSPRLKLWLIIFHFNQLLDFGLRSHGTGCMLFILIS